MRLALVVAAFIGALSPVASHAQQVPPLPIDSVAAADSAAIPRDTLPQFVRPPLSAAADSIAQLLRSLEGFVATEYLGQSAIYRADTGILRLIGEAEVSRGADQLQADTIEYSEGRELITAIGNARVAGAGQQPLEGRVLYYDLARSRATALGARTQVDEGATWYITGDVSAERETNRLFGRNAHFTSCDLTIPHYHFEADQVMVIRDRVLVARPARLYFGNVPVMVLQFVVQNLEQGRRSGFLTPRFGLHDIVRTSSGYNRQISDLGFYWAINDYLGAQISTTWRSGAYTALMGNLAFNWREQFLNGRLGVDRFWVREGTRELNLTSQGTWQPDERTNMSFSGSYATSSQFVRDATYDPTEATQDLQSSFSLGRRFDWGRVSLGASRQQSIATGDVSMTLPSFSISPNTLTLFRAPREAERWFNNATFNPGVISGSRSTGRFEPGQRSPRQDTDRTQLRVSPSFSMGNFSISGSGDVNRQDLFELTAQDSQGEPITLAGSRRDDANWSVQASYRQQLIGSTNISPNISLSQQLRRDTLTAGEILAAPMRLSFGAALGTDLYGFFPGAGPYSAIRHRFSPRLSYAYAPEVRQTDLQTEVFGRAGGRTRNVLSLSLGQTFEAKLTEPRAPEPPALPQDSLTGDTIPQTREPPVPSDPQKVTILSITTSPLEYDFIKAREEGNGFITDRISNTITSDYLRGLSIQMQHELFDRRDFDPQLPENAGRLGEFAPRLSSLSTSFQLGPQSALFAWVERLGLLPRTRPGQTEGILQDPQPSTDPSPAGEGAFTGNPQGTGGGPWRMSLAYEFSRPPRSYDPTGTRIDEVVQTLGGTVDFQLTPNWSVNWVTTYSITDNEFGSHRLNFRRDLHEWQANFSFYQTPFGVSAFEFYVELLHNRDIRLDYGESNLGVDRPR